MLKELMELQEEFHGEYAIFGAGLRGKGDFYDFLKKVGFFISFYLDNYVSPGTVIKDGIAVREMEYLYEHKDNVYVFLCVSDRYLDEIKKQLEVHGIKQYCTMGSTQINLFMSELEFAGQRIQERFWNLYDDETYLREIFCKRVGYELNLEKPSTFNEKIQWLKLHDRNPRYTVMADKYAVKQYVSERIGEKYIIPTIGIWDTFQQIDFGSLPNQFVLKCTHDSGSVVVCRDKTKWQPLDVKEHFVSALQKNYYYYRREWQYKDIPPRIMAEQYMQNENNSHLMVYKIFCFNGKPRIAQVIQNDKQPEETIDYFDIDWNMLDLRQNFPNSKTLPECPKTWEEMLYLAQKLSADIAFLRVDFYEVNGNTYFSEFTFHSDAGFASFTPPDWDKKLGDLIQLPEKEY